MKFYISKHSRIQLSFSLSLSLSRSVMKSYGGDKSRCHWLFIRPSFLPSFLPFSGNLGPRSSFPVMNSYVTSESRCHCWVLRDAVWVRGIDFMYLPCPLHLTKSSSLSSSSLMSINLAHHSIRGVHLDSGKWHFYLHAGGHIWRKKVH